jgi:hypothetical protein
MNLSFDSSQDGGVVYRDVMRHTRRGKRNIRAGYGTDWRAIVEGVVIG